MKELFLMGFGFMFGWLIGMGMMASHMERCAVKANVGYYNPTNARFQFVVLTNLPFSNTNR